MCNTHLTVDNGSTAAQHTVGSVIYKWLPLLHGSRYSSNSLNCACGDSVSGGGRGALLPGRRATMGGWTWPFLGQAAQAGLGLYHLGGKRRNDRKRDERRGGRVWTSESDGVGLTRLIVSGNTQIGRDR